MDFAKVKRLVKSDKFIISHHARVRMFERNISTDEIMEIVIKGEIIEDYAQDKLCPSALILGYLDNRPFHAVVAECDDHVRIITIYKPEEDQWIDYRRRK